MNEIPKVSLGKLITLERRPVQIDPVQEYAEIGIYCFGRGIFHKTPRSGLEVGNKKLFQIKEGDFILQVTFAWEGAIALASSLEDGMYGSTRFPTFRVDEESCFAPYLLNYFRTPEGLEQIVKISPGSAGRNRVLSLKRIPEVLVPLPSIAEQRRIVARIEEIAAKIEEARGLREGAIERCQQLVTTEAGKVFDSLSRQYSISTFKDFQPHITSGPRYWNKRYSVNGLRFYRAQDISSNSKVTHNSKVYVTPPETDEGSSARLMPGDLMIVITGATIGRCAIFEKDLEQGYVSQHVSLCRLPKERVNPYFSLWGLRSSMGQEQLLESKYGQGKPGLNLTNIRNLHLPFPPIGKQNAIVAYLDDFREKVEAMVTNRASALKEFDALLPAILDKAFKGEL